MSGFGKKILSAFVEVTEEEKSVAKPEEVKQTSTVAPVSSSQSIASSSKFKSYFEQLFKEANLPGPDYFEFSKMIEAMQGIPDERSRYTAAFAGLNVQGLDREKLLSTANQYLEILHKDAANFNATVDAALQEKVQGKQQEVVEKEEMIKRLSNEIAALQESIALLKNEIAENEEKIKSNTGGYTAGMEEMKGSIERNIQRIKEYIA